MLNTTGLLAVMDHGVTLNWDDGPTLHRMTAQVRYHTAAIDTAQSLPVLATTSHEGDPFTFVQANESLQAEWTWREGTAGDDGSATETVLYWAARLAVTNLTEEDLFVDGLDVIRIDAAQAGQFNLGAPLGLWRCADESTPSEVRWQTWAQGAGGAQSILRTRELLVQPSASNRTRPPALLVRAVDAASDAAQPLPTEIVLDVNDERFESLAARCRTDGVRLATHETLTTAWFVLASGDDAGELRGLQPVLDE